MKRLQYEDWISRPADKNFEFTSSKYSILASIHHHVIPFTPHHRGQNVKLVYLPKTNYIGYMSVSSINGRMCQIN